MIASNPYLMFPGSCEEAFSAYASVLGGTILAKIRMGDMPMPCPEDMQDKIAHIRMTVGQTILMGSDAPPQHVRKPEGFAVNIGTDTPEEADRIFAALAEGGEVQVPIAETHWAHRFGMCTDRFGTPWMVNCEKPLP